MSARKVTNQVIENVENGLISWESIARSCLNYMSEYDVADMAESEGLVIEDDEEE